MFTTVHSLVFCCTPVWRHNLKPSLFDFIFCSSFLCPLLLCHISWIYHRKAQWDLIKEASPSKLAPEPLSGSPRSSLPLPCSYCLSRGFILLPSLTYSLRFLFSSHFSLSQHQTHSSLDLLPLLHRLLISEQPIPGFQTRFNPLLQFLATPTSESTTNDAPWTVVRTGSAQADIDSSISFSHNLALMLDLQPVQSHLHAHSHVHSHSQSHPMPKATFPSFNCAASATVYTFSSARTCWFICSTSG